MSGEPVSGITHREYETNGLTLHAVTAGPEDGEPVVLLHGFPEFWYGWRHQLSALADAGYRVVVPDQRGYNRSDKPPNVAAYTADRLATDVVGLFDRLGYETANVVGHDWGGAVTWYLLFAYPERVARATIMNLPHPQAFAAYLKRKPNQLRRSAYMFFFQVPRLPEWALSAADWRGLRWFLDSANRPDAFTEEDLRRYHEAWSQPGACTGMLNWYRALFQADRADPPTQVAEPPTMLIWGMQDPYLHPGLATASIEHCANGRLERLTDATHWLQHEVPDQINTLLLDFLEP